MAGRRTAGTWSGQPGGCYMIQQRLEQVMVVFIDNGDLRARVLELLAERQPAESAADDHDVNSLFFHARGCFAARGEKANGT